MATKDISGNWMNSGGNFIPAGKVQKIFKVRDAVVMKIYKRMKKLEAAMKKAKAQNFADVEDYLAKLTKARGVEKDIKGNITLSSYDNLYKVELSKNEIEGFDEQLNAAKSLIDQCIIDWSKGSHANLVPVITEAFRLNSNKRFNTNAIWALTKLNIKDAKWQKAMELVKNSRETLGSRQYMSVSYRKSLNSLFKSLNMNFSSMDIFE